MTDTGMWVADDETAAEAVQTRRAWLEGLGAHERVLAQYAMRTEAEIAEDREIRNRSAELRQRAEDEASAIQMGFAGAPPSHQDILARFALAADEQDRRLERVRAEEAERRADAATEALAAARRELAQERKQHERASRLATERLNGWQAARAEYRR